MFVSALSTIGFGDMVPTKGNAPSSAIQTLEYIIRGLYLVIGLVLVSSLVSSVVSAVNVLDGWDCCRRTRCEYKYIEDIPRWREDMNFIFEWPNNILRTSAASE